MLKCIVFEVMYLRDIVDSYTMNFSVTCTDTSISIFIYFQQRTYCLLGTQYV